MEKNNIRLYCNDCHKTTNQEILYTTEKKEQFDEEGQDIIKTVVHNLVQCKGCEFIGLQIVTTDTNDENGNVNEYSFIYPEEEEYEDDRFLGYDEMKFLSKPIKKTYEEVTDAIDYDLRLLADIGLRTLVEAICINQKITGRNLKGKIDNLHSKGFISANELPILHKLREIGNLGAHQIKSPSSTVLENALEIINHLLRSVYIIPKRSKKIK